MFLEFFYLLRAKGLEVSINEWMTLMEALDKGLAHSSFLSFYYLCRSILIKTEADYDKFDAVFAEYFKDVHTPEDLPAEFWKWLSEDEQERDINDMGTGDEWRKSPQIGAANCRRAELQGFQTGQGTGYQTVSDGIQKTSSVLFACRWYEDGAGYR